MPNRSTFVGGPPQFGQLNATGPCCPAGTIGCWIGGGGGIDRRLASWAKAMIRTMMTKITGMQRNGAAENRKALGNQTRKHAMAKKAPRITTIATTMRPNSG